MPDLNTLAWILGVRAAEWGIIAFLEYKVAKAKADGVANWEDSYWLSMLRRVDSAKAERIERSGP